jgi:hypothetical protein
LYRICSHPTQKDTFRTTHATQDCDDRCHAQTASVLVWLVDERAELLSLGRSQLPNQPERDITASFTAIRMASPSACDEPGLGDLAAAR